MDKTPFSVYDFFAYLAAGSAVISAIDYAYGSTILRSKDISAVIAVVLLLAAYVVGQMVAHISAWLYENLIVRRLLLTPTVHLMRSGPNNTKGRLIFPAYFKCLPTSVQEKVRTQALTRKCSALDDGLFMHCYAASTAALDKLQGRLDDFRTQYGFARNMSCALLIAAATITIYRLDGRPLDIRWALLSLGCSVILLYRYLKFFRQYSYELLLRYAELPLPKD